MKPARRTITALAILYTSILFSPPRHARAVEPSQAEIESWISQLGSEDFQRRETAEKSLIDAGSHVIPFLGDPSLLGDAEADNRACRILLHFYASHDDAPHREALHALQRLAESENPTAVDAIEALTRRRQDALTWIKRHGGEWDEREVGGRQAIVAVRLDRTRGIDPGFYADGISDADYRWLTTLRDIENLTLANRPKLTDDGLKHIAKLHKLNTLNLGSTHITGRGLAHLKNLSHLRTLQLFHCRNLRGEGAAGLAELTQLTSLQLDADSDSGRGTSDDGWKQQLRMLNLGPPHSASLLRQLAELRGGFSDVDLQQIAELSNLETLSLVKTHITGDGLQALSKLTNLRHLDLSQTAITDEGLKHVAELSNLKALRLNFTLLTDEGVAELRKLRNLEVLELRGVNLSDAGVDELRSMVNLQALDLSLTDVSGKTADALGELPKLVRLNLEQTNFDLQGILRLAEKCRHIDLDGAFALAGWGKMNASRQLASLNLSLNVNVSRSAIGDKDLSFLSRLPELRFLGLEELDITDRGLAHVSGLTKLQTVWVGSTSVTDAGLNHLSPLVNLHALSVRGSQITLSGLIEFLMKQQDRDATDALGIAHTPRNWRRPKSDEEFVALDLRGIEVADSDLALVAELARLEVLLIDQGRVSDSGLAHLADLKRLKTLWVDGSEMTGEGLKSLISLEQLEILGFTNAALRDGDLTHLSAFPSLRVLNLCGASISTLGVVNLRRLSSLEYLIVDHTAVSDLAAKVLRSKNPDLYIARSQKSFIDSYRRAERDLLGPGGRDALSTKLESPPDKPGESHLLETIFGKEYFEHVYRVSVQNATIALHGHWRWFPTVESVSLVNVDVPTEALLALKKLPLLKSLSFYRSNVDDEDAKHIGELLQLEELDLQCTKITDAALADLSNLTRLRNLSLGGYGTEINDPGFVHLAKLTNLESLDLCRTAIGDAALENLKPLGRLKQLDLRKVRVDHGLRHLSDLTSLEAIDLYRTEVSDDTLRHFYGLKNLRRVDLTGTRATSEGVRQLQNRLPQASVSFRP